MSEDIVLLSSDEDVIEEGEISSSDDEQFSLKKNEYTILMIGDERADHINLCKWKNFPTQEFSTQNSATIENLNDLLQKKMSDKYKFVFIFSLVWDIVYIDPEDRILKLKTDINIDELIDKISKLNQQWKKMYTNTCFIWILPNPPDFVTINKSQKNPGLIQENVDTNMAASKFWYYIQSIERKLNKMPLHINIFCLNNVLFFKNEKIIKTFTGLCEPKFPAGHLNQGLFFTPITNMYFGHLMSNYLVTLETKKKKMRDAPSTSSEKFRDLQAALFELKEKLDIQFSIYKATPSLHSKYPSVYNDFLKSGVSDLDEGQIEMKWKDFWAIKLKQYYQELWNIEEKQLSDKFALDLQPKDVSKETIEKRKPSNVSDSSSDLELLSEDTNSKTKKVNYESDTSHSSSSSITSQESTSHNEQQDLDSQLDALVESKSFMDDLDELDNELKDIFSEEEVQDNKVNLIKQESEKSSELENVDKNEIMHLLTVLKMIESIKTSLGILGEKLSHMCKLAILKYGEGKNPLNLIEEEENKVLLCLANGVLKKLSRTEDSSIKALVYKETSTVLNNIVEKYKLEINNNFPGVNTYNLAYSTIGKDTSTILEFIKDILLYEGYENVKEIQLMSLFINVKQIHSKIIQDKS